MFKNKYFKISLILILLCLIPASLQADVLIEKDIEARIEKFQLKYEIPFRYKNLPIATKYVKYKELEYKEYSVLNEYLDLFEVEILKYPSGFFKNRDVRGIGLVMHLFVNDKPAQGLYNSASNTMFFDVTRFGKNKAKQRHSIHHEIFHMMSQSISANLILDDDEWSELNVQSFQYGEKQKSLRNKNPVNKFAPNQLGFVTYYAMYSPKEDQAEVFACMMQSQHSILINEWKLKDSVMNEKILVIKKFTKHYNSEMGNKFWETIE